MRFAGDTEPKSTVGTIASSPHRHAGGVLRERMIGLSRFELMTTVAASRHPLCRVILIGGRLRFRYGFSF
jgi:hypothetical protein